MEGSSTHLFQPGLERADIILNLKFGNILSQYWSLIKRNRTRDYESFHDLIKLLIYVTKKRFGFGNKKEKIKAEILKPYTDKEFSIFSFKEIDEIVDEIVKK